MRFALCAMRLTEIPMKQMIENVLETASLKGADYADIRIVRRQTEEFEVKNGDVEGLTHDEEFGFGIRVLFRVPGDSLAVQT